MGRSEPRVGQVQCTILYELSYQYGGGGHEEYRSPELPHIVPQGSSSGLRPLYTIGIHAFMSTHLSGKHLAIS